MNEKCFSDVTVFTSASGRHAFHPVPFGEDAYKTPRNSDTPADFKACPTVLVRMTGIMILLFLAFPFSEAEEHVVNGK